MNNIFLIVNRNNIHFDNVFIQQRSFDYLFTTLKKIVFYELFKKILLTFLFISSNLLKTQCN
jgi:hypothetical protein